MRDSPYYFRPIRRSTVGYLKAFGAENALITPIKDDKMFVPKVVYPTTQADTTMNKIIDALSTIGILASPEESMLENVIKNTSPNYNTAEHISRRLISKSMLMNHLERVKSTTSSTEDYFNYDFSPNTGAMDIGPASTDSVSDTEIALLQTMVGAWEKTFQSVFITVLQFITTYDALERSQDRCDTVYTGILRLPGYTAPHGGA